MAQMLDLDAIFATAELRDAWRCAQRGRTSQDAYRAEREEEKKRKAAWEEAARTQ